MPVCCLALLQLFHGVKNPRLAFLPPLSTHKSPFFRPYHELQIALSRVIATRPLVGYTVFPGPHRTHTPNCPSLSITNPPCIELLNFHLGSVFIFLLLPVICLERSLQSLKMRMLCFLLDRLEPILPNFSSLTWGVRDAPVLGAQCTGAVSTIT